LARQTPVGPILLEAPKAGFVVDRKELRHWVLFNLRNLTFCNFGFGPVVSPRFGQSQTTYNNPCSLPPWRVGWSLDWRPALQHWSVSERGSVVEC